MNCSELRDHFELYSLGLAEEPECGEIRAHLARGCEVCVGEIQRAREMAALLGSSAAPAAPSPKLRRRILASVGSEQRRFGWAPFLAGATALLLCAALYFAGRERQYFDEASALRAQTRTEIIELTRLHEAFAILNGADTTVTSFGENQPKPKGKVFLNPSRGLLLIASNLPPAPAGKAYELWFLPKGGEPVRAGMFQSASDGTVMYLEGGAVDGNGAKAVAVTMEADTGVDAPTGDVLILAELPAAVK
jgi:hypothetical protein